MVVDAPGLTADHNWLDLMAQLVWIALMPNLTLVAENPHQMTPVLLKLLQRNKNTSHRSTAELNQSI